MVMENDIPHSVVEDLKDLAGVLSDPKHVAIVRVASDVITSMHKWAEREGEALRRTAMTHASMLKPTDSRTLCEEAKRIEAYLRGEYEQFLLKQKAKSNA